MKKESVLETLTMLLDFMEKIEAPRSRFDDLKTDIAIVAEPDKQREELNKLFRRGKEI